MNVYIARAGFDVMDVATSVDVLLALQDRMPRQVRRDVTQIEFQQFSTPPAEALLVVSAAGLCSGLAVLEPSAGTGNLAVLARLAGAAVDTNEIDPRRRKMLELQGFSPSAFDAERLHNLLPPERIYDAIVMNPPFSATGGRVNGHSTEFGARHVEQALLRLKPGGRLVAIVGRGMALDRPKFRAWWANIECRFRVRANIGIHGAAYAKFGTSFDHQIIVLDNNGPTASESDIIAGTGLTLHDAWHRLKELSEEDVYGRICRFNSVAGVHGASNTHPPGMHAGSGSGHRTDFASGGAGTGRLTDVVSGIRGNGRVDSLEPTHRGTATGDADGNHRDAGAGAANDTAGCRNDAGVGGDTRAQHTGPAVDDVTAAQERGPPVPLQVEDGSVYATYRVQKAGAPGAEPHPANVVESVAMASVESPDPTYKLCLPAEVIHEGRVSDIQIEDVIYAGQATESLLPDGSRRGHWNGDGTGIGKGREIYAFIYDQYQRGRAKHVHISASHQLVADAERDRSAVGVPLPIIHQARFKTADRIITSEGVFFTTYTMLSLDFGGERQRFKQLTEWLGPDFDGVIAFDEAHLMKNAAATPHGGKVPMPRRVLRLLCRATRPVLIATTLGHALRCLYYRNNECCPDGRCKASWVANVFEVDVRNVKAARRELVELSLLVMDATDQRSMNRWGPRVRFDLTWQPPLAHALRPPPRSAANPGKSPPPNKNRELVSRSWNQKPAARGPNGAYAAGSGARRLKIERVTPRDLAEPERIAEFYATAVQQRLIRHSESERLNVFAAAEHAKAHGITNPCGMFVWLVKQRRWNHLTMRDEDCARDALRGLERRIGARWTVTGTTPSRRNGSASDAARCASPEAARRSLADTECTDYPILVRLTTFLNRRTASVRLERT